MSTTILDTKGIAVGTYNPETEGVAALLERLHALQGATDIIEADFGVDDGLYDAGSHLLHGISHVFHAAAERTEDLQLLLEELHEVHLR